MQIRGSVDSVTPTEVLGWAYAPGCKGGLSVQATLNHEIVGEALANLYRADLAAVRLGDGKCGFMIPLCRKVDPLYLPFLVVRPEGADVEFPRTSVSGYAEFFRSVYQGYPAVGRQRSVYGGLWTDRTDAAALLRGKVTIGTIDASLTSELRQIISAGFTVMTAEDYSSDEGNKSPFSGLASKILDRPWLVEVMRAILDDVPVVVEMKEVTSSEASLAQASASGNLPSPAECLALVVPCSGQSVDVDVVPREPSIAGVHA